MPGLRGSWIDCDLGGMLGGKWESVMGRGLW